MKVVDYMHYRGHLEYDNWPLLNALREKISYLEELDARDVWDSTWRNEGCPSISIGEELQVFVDYFDPERKDFEEALTISIITLHDGCHYFATNHPEEALYAIKGYFKARS